MSLYIYTKTKFTYNKGCCFVVAVDLTHKHAFAHQQIWPGFSRECILHRVSDTECNLISLVNHQQRHAWFLTLSFSQPPLLNVFVFLSSPHPPLILSLHWLLSVQLPVNCWAVISSCRLPPACSDELVGPAASACQLRLLTSDPGYSPRLLLRMLLQGDCHLPRMLLGHARKLCFSLEPGWDESVCYDGRVCYGESLC